MYRIIISSIFFICFAIFSQTLLAQTSEELGFRTDDDLNIKFKSKKTVPRGNRIYIFESPRFQKGNEVLRKKIQVTIFQDEIKDVDEYLKQVKNYYKSLGGTTYYRQANNKDVKVLFHLVIPERNGITLYNYSAIFYYNGRAYWLFLQTTFKNYKKIFKEIIDGFHLID